MDDNNSGRFSRGKKVLLVVAAFLLIVFVALFFVQNGQSVKSFSNDSFSIEYPEDLTPQTLEQGAVSFKGKIDAGATIQSFSVQKNAASENNSTPELLAKRLSQPPKGRTENKLAPSLSRTKVNGREVLFVQNSLNKRNFTKTAYVFDDSTLWRLQFKFKDGNDENNQEAMNIILASFDPRKA